MDENTEVLEDTPVVVEERMPMVVADDLVEDVSIDGMCGVY